jgi:hypothetical protein
MFLVTRKSCWCAVLCISILFASGISDANYTDFKDENSNQTAALKIKYGDIPVIIVHGTHREMGVQYGRAMQNELRESLSILENYYTEQRGISYQKLLANANLLYARFPVSFQLFIQGVAQGSNLNLNDAKILNAMATMGSIASDEGGHCSFLAITPRYTSTNATLIGRNYDFPTPFDKIAQYLTITILKEDNAEPTAIISLPGEIYCPSCVNADGLFMELNSGSPSGGEYVDVNRQSLLINMLQIMQNSKDLQQMEKELNATQSDYSLIINTADNKQIKSYEFSSTLGMHTLFPPSDANFASTNFYLSDAWHGIPAPTDETTWMGVTRRNNLLNLSAAEKSFDIKTFESLMDKNIKDGGAVWDLTVYQIIFDPSDLSLYLKVHSSAAKWVRVPLKELF